jgi:hypothetical protein
VAGPVVAGRSDADGRQRDDGTRGTGTGDEQDVFGGRLARTPYEPAFEAIR